MPTANERRDLRLVETGEVASETTDTAGTDSAEKDLLTIIEEVEREARKTREADKTHAREAREEDTRKKLEELAMLKLELIRADEKVSHLPKDIRDRALVAMKPRRVQIENRIEELLRDPGVLIDSIDKLIAKVGSTADWGNLSRLTQECIDSGFLTAEKNKKGNISFITVRPVQGRNHEVNEQVIKLSRTVHAASMDLEKRSK